MWFYILAMERFDFTLQDKIDKYRWCGIDYQALIKISIQLGLAILSCHNRGIIHGNLKPQKILIKKSEDGFFVSLTDFREFQKTIELDSSRITK